MANSVDPDQTAPEDQTAPSGAVWSGSTLFAYVILSDALVFEFLGYLPYASEGDFSGVYIYTSKSEMQMFFISFNCRMSRWGLLLKERICSQSEH